MNDADNFLADAYAALPIVEKMWSCMTCGERFATLEEINAHKVETEDGPICPTNVPAPREPVKGPNFPVRYFRAREAYFTALKHTKPLDAETAAILQEKMPEQWAETMEKVDAIKATLPALEAEYRRFDDVACNRCNGMGEYSGASRIYKDGKKMCFKCHGRGYC